MKAIHALPFAIALALPRVVFAGDYQGADAILKTLDAGQPAKKMPVPASEQQANESAAKLRKDIAAYIATSAKLGPAAAAKGWLDLAVRFIHYRASSSDLPTEIKEKDPFDFYLLMAALPPSTAWDEIARQADQLPAHEKSYQPEFRMQALKLLIHRLNLQHDAAARDLAALDEQQKKWQFEPLTVHGPTELSQTVEADQQGLENLHQILEKEAAPSALDFKMQNEELDKVNNDGKPESFRLQNVISWAGRDKAAEFLRRLLKANVVIDFTGAGETRDLARSMALELVPEMKVPQWGLVKSPDDAKIYEAMAKRFPPPASGEYLDRSSYPLHTAMTYYLHALLDAGQMEEAGVFLEKSSPEEYYFSFSEKDQAAPEKLADFFHDQLAKKPTLFFWDTYMRLARMAGKDKEMFDLLEATAERKDVTGRKKINARYNLYHAYLRAGRINDALALLRKQSASWEETATSQKPDDPDADPGTINYYAEDIVWIGKLLGRKDLIEEGIKALKLSPAATHPKDFSEYGSFVEKILDLDDSPESEALVLQLAGMAKEPREKMSALCQAIKFYHHVHRPADVVTLLDRSPWWGGADLEYLGEDKAAIGGITDYSGYYAASALAAIGHKEEAAKILNALLDAKGNYEPAYELLVKVMPRDAVLARLDVMAARDKLEPQPLIWKAHALFDAGKLEQAERVARQAVALAPQDTRQEQGRSMRAYAVLADIREARGDKKEAAQLREIVTAMRLSENAHTLAGWGLRVNGIKAYEESLAHYPDEFRTQFQFAKLLEKAGDTAAEEHYRHAFGLLPASFGYFDDDIPDSDHCQDEALFHSSLARKVAEEVVPSLVKQHPEKPQAHYLLACLRMEEQRYGEALAEFREAVKLDPEYFDAWKKLDGFSGMPGFTAADRDAIAIQLIRLDPLCRHRESYQGRVDDLIDLKSAWGALDAAWKVQPPAATGPVYPLKAAAREIEKEQIEHVREGYAPIAQTMYPGPDIIDAPGYAIAKNPFISAVIGLVDSGRQPLIPEHPLPPW